MTGAATARAAQRTKGDFAEQATQQLPSFETLASTAGATHGNRSVIKLRHGRGACSAWLQKPSYLSDKD